MKKITLILSLICNFALVKYANEEATIDTGIAHKNMIIFNYLPRGLEVQTSLSKCSILDYSVAISPSFTGSEINKKKLFFIYFKSYCLCCL